LHATVVPGSGQVIRLVDSGSAKGAPAKSGLSAKMDEARQEWRQAMSQVKQPGKMHRAVRNCTTTRPSAIHRRGNSLLRGIAGAAEVRGRVPQGRGVAGDRYSATAGEPGARFTGYTTRLRHDEAWRTGGGRGLQALVRWRPPLLPQGTRLNGSVLQVRPARHLKHNGELRISFHELVLPSGSVRVDTTLEGIQTGEADNASLDPEGGPRRRIRSRAM
jgi:hypothetical protein